MCIVYELICIDTIDWQPVKTNALWYSGFCSQGQWRYRWVHACVHFMYRTAIMDTTWSRSVYCMYTVSCIMPCSIYSRRVCFVAFGYNEWCNYTLVSCTPQCYMSISLKEMTRSLIPLAPSLSQLRGLPSQERVHLSLWWLAQIKKKEKCSWRIVVRQLCQTKTKGHNRQCCVLQQWESPMQHWSEN